MKKKILETAAAIILTAAMIPCGYENSFADDINKSSQTSVTETLMEKTTAEKEDIIESFEKIPVDSFSIGNLSPEIITDMDHTEWWYSEWDNCRYIFLPSTADRKNLTISYSAEDDLFLNDIKVKSGETTSLLDMDDEFDIKAGDKNCGKLKIMQSDLGCIYLTTSSGGLDALDKNKNLTETGSALMLNSKGSIEYKGEIEKITSHGNSSWDYSKKKPYNIKLPEKSDLYGMGKAKKWVLLSNYLDHSMLRNKLTEEMCRDAGMEYVMDSVFVDLYADGSYRGTYQIYEKVQVQKNRVDIKDLEKETEKANTKSLSEYKQKVVGAEKATDYMENSYKYYDIPNDPDDITGGYLLEFFQWNRYGKKTESGFITSRGQAIGIKGPEYASKAQIEYIRSFVQDMEDAIYSENGINSKGKHYSEYMDVDSLIKAYLVQEISENIDATFSSFFMWKDSDTEGDGKIHFGPAWDFDLSYNNFSNSRINSDGNRGYSSNPENLFAAYFPIHGYEDGGNGSTNGSGRPTEGMSWIGKLYKNEEFVKRAAEVYFDKFEKYLNDLTDGDNPYIIDLAESISSSAEMSNARWHTYGGKDYTVFGSSSGPTFFDSVDILRQYIQKRKNWLTKLWEPYIHLEGDVNSDDIFNVSDIVLMQKYILNYNNTGLSVWQAGDLCRDGKINILDMCLMKRKLLEDN